MTETILIIEDNDLNFELVSDLLELRGFRILHAPRAEEGLRMAREYLPALVLMDLSLPGIDGLTATKTFKADPAIRHLPVVALTAHAMKGDEKIALSAGCDGYLTKPIDTHTFAAAVEHFIAQAKSLQLHSKTNPLCKT